MAAVFIAFIVIGLAALLLLLIHITTWGRRGYDWFIDKQDKSTARPPTQSQRASLG